MRTMEAGLQTTFGLSKNLLHFWRQSLFLNELRLRVKAKLKAPQYIRDMRQQGLKQRPEPIGRSHGRQVSDMLVYRTCDGLGCAVFGFKRKMGPAIQVGYYRLVRVNRPASGF